jgi:hypothetical protein
LLLACCLLAASNHTPPPFPLPLHPPPSSSLPFDPPQPYRPCGALLQSLHPPNTVLQNLPNSTLRLICFQLPWARCQTRASGWVRDLEPMDVSFGRPGLLHLFVRTDLGFLKMGWKRRKKGGRKGMLPECSNRKNDRVAYSLTPPPIIQPTKTIPPQPRLPSQPLPRRNRNRLRPRQLQRILSPKHPRLLNLDQIPQKRFTNLLNPRLKIPYKSA